MPVHLQTIPATVWIQRRILLEAMVATDKAEPMVRPERPARMETSFLSKANLATLVVQTTIAKVAGASKGKSALFALSLVWILVPMATHAKELP